MILFRQSIRSHGSFSLPWRTLLLLSLALAGYLLPGAAPEAWVFDRSAIAQGELWRLVTGHWVHSDLNHALWDIAALALLGALFETRLQRHLLPALIIGTFGVDLWLWWGNTALDYYCGLSGILNSLLAIGLIRLWQDVRHPVIWLTGLGAVGKILFEMVNGQAIVTQTAWPSVPDVHAIGFLSGLLAGYLFFRVSHSQAENLFCRAKEILGKPQKLKQN